jgi:type IV pilus assembly protein PilM
MSRTAAIELNETDAKVVQVSWSRKTGPLLEKAFRVPFGPLGRDGEAARERGARLRDALRQHKVHTAEAVLVVPKQSATLRRVRLPSADPGELASMARFEAEKLIPFNVERHIITHAIVGSHGLEGTDVLLAAIDESVMAPMLESLSAAGVDPAVAEVSSLAVGYAAFEKLDGAEATQCQALVQIGWSHTDIAIYNGGELVATRSVLHGVRNLLEDLSRALQTELALGPETLGALDALNPSEYQPTRRSSSQSVKREVEAGAEFEILEATNAGDSPLLSDPVPAVNGWVGKLATNLRRTYEFSLREYAIPPLKRVLLTGEGAMIRHLAQAVETQLDIPVAAFDPLAEVPRGEKAGIDEPMVPAYACAYGAALRLARDGSDSTVNLLPPALLQRRRHSEMLVHYVATGAMVLVAALMVVIWMWSSGQHRAEQYRRYETYTADLGGLVGDIEDMRDRIAIIKGIKSERAGALQILDGISAYEPIGISTSGGRLSLTDFEFRLGEEIRVTGHALEIEDINKFVYYLKNLKNEKGELMFENVDIRTQNPTSLPRRDQTIYEFEIVGLLFLEG